jgi:hypothetical protein
MSVHTLLLSVLVTFIAVGVSFFYFKNRMTRTEQKVDLMFQLIQEHEKSSQIRQQFVPQQQHVGGQFVNEVVNEEKELIQISDDESEYDSDDSAEVSDADEDEAKLHFGNSDDPLVDSIKTISLSLEGAETANISMNDVDELSEHEIGGNEPMNINKLGSVEIEEIVDEIISDIEDGLDEVTLSDDEIIEEVKEDYSKMTKGQLKTIAEAKGLTNYKQLKKGALVELITSSP